MSSAIAIIPARGGSKRLPRKNVLNFLGEPVISYPIKAALNSAVFDQVFVSTDDDEIRAIAQKSGADILERPDHLADDISNLSDVCVDALQSIKHAQDLPAYFCLIYATAVMVEPQDLQRSFDAFKKSNADVMPSVSGYPLHPYKALIKNESGFFAPQWPEESKKNSQDYPDFVAINGMFCWARCQEFLEAGGFFTDKMGTYETPAERSVDIDTAEDFTRAERFAKAYWGTKS